MYMYKNVKEGIKMEVAVKINYSVLCVFMARLREEKGVTYSVGGKALHEFRVHDFS
jgi:hypothetical protein